MPSVCPYQSFLLPTCVLTRVSDNLIFLFHFVYECIKMVDEYNPHF